MKLSDNNRQKTDLSTENSNNSVINILEANKKHTNDQVKDYLLKSGNGPTNISINNQITNLTNNIQEISSNIDVITISKLKDTLDELYDLYSGGVTQYKIDNTIIRDARNIDLNKKVENKKILDGISYTISILNNMQGALSILQNIDSEDSTYSRLFKETMHEFYKNITNQEWHKITKRTWKLNNKKIVSLISKILHDKNIKKQKIKQRIEFASNLNNLKDNHYNIVTLTKIDDQHTAVESDTMLTTLTKKQKEDFLKIKNSNNNDDLPQWFVILDHDIRQMIKNNIDYFLSEKKILPNQILFIPGVRNAYEKNTQIITKNNEKYQIETLATSKHCGTPAVKIKNFIDEYLTNTKYKDKNKIISTIESSMHTENINQLKQFIPENKQLAFNILNSNTYFANKEKFIFDQVKNSANNLDIKNYFLPVNARRNIDAETHYQEKEIYDIFYNHYVKDRDIHNNYAIKHLLNFFSYNENKGFWTRLLDKLPKLKKFIHKLSGKYQMTTKIINNMNNPIIQELFAVKKILEYGLKQNNNKSIEIVKHMQKLYNLVQTGHNKTSESFVTCKSGKDRTGYAELKISAYALAQYFQNKSTQLNSMQYSEEDILTKIGNAGHSQYIASVNGGTKGAKGIKSSYGFLGKKDYPVLNPIINKSIAKINKMKLS